MDDVRKLQIAVIGSASNTLDESQQDLAFATGKKLVELGCRLITGGLGGVMAQSARGARSASNYMEGDTMGVLPSYNAADANPWIDIALPTGLGVARNAVLMASCDAVIALDGGSGTLSEIALAWQMQKPIACIGALGWHQRLDSLQLDSRRNEKITLLTRPDDIAAFLASVTGVQTYKGVGSAPLSSADACKIAHRILPGTLACDAFKPLGRGSEAVVVSNSQWIAKIFYRNDYQMLLYANLSALAAAAYRQTALPVFSLHNGEYLMVYYPYFESTSYNGGEQAAMIRFLQKMQSIQWCLSNVKAENFRVNALGELVFIDIGRDILPYSPPLFLSMCKRAFLTCEYTGHPSIKVFCSYTNSHDDFEGIAAAEGVNKTAEALANDFEKFFKAIVDD